MKLVLKIVGGLLVLLVVAGVGYNAMLTSQFEKNVQPNAPLPNITASKDEEVIKRGEYLVNVVAHCSVCHQEGKLEDRKIGFKSDFSGGYTWDIPMFGKFYSRNITQDPETGLGKWSDGEIARAIRHSVGRDGKFLGFMSFATGSFSDEDLTAIISYLRTIPPVKKVIPPEEYRLFVKLLFKDWKPRELVAPAYVPPGGGVSVERGRYLAEGPAVCSGCHTPLDMMTMQTTGPKFSGAAEAEPDHLDEQYEIIPPNLTPDKETGHITTWDEEQFVARFKAGPVFKGSKMPWENFAGLTDDDVRSIYRFLKSLPPAKHEVGPTRRKAGWKPEKKT